MMNIRTSWPAAGVFALLLSAAGAPAATITVTTTADDLIPNDGSVSLREAIMAMNAGNTLGDPDITAQNPGIFGVNDTINFNIPGTGVRIINVGTDPSATGLPLPTMVKPVSINGYSQVGSLKNTLAQPNHDNAVLVIQLNGASAGAAANGLKLGPGSGGSTVQGLIISHFSGNGIDIESPGNTIDGNFIGTDASGNNAGPGNANDGVLISKAGGNVIGGNTPAARNVISFNGVHGIEIVVQPDTVDGNVISGNGKNHGQGDKIQITGNVVDDNH